MTNKLRPSKPAPTSRLIESASWQATSVPRSVRERRVSLVPRASSRSTDCGSALAVANAGIEPKARPASSATNAVTSMAPPSSDSAAVLGSDCARSPRSASSARVASSSPAAPPANPSSTLSDSSCRTRRERPAPSATRTANSRRRESARDSSTPAKFAHATSSTKAPLASRIRSGVRVSPTTASRIDRVVTL